MPSDDLLESYEQDERALKGALLREPISALEPRQPVLVAPQQRMREAVDLMVASHTGCVCVVERECLIGIFTERDLLHALQGGVDFESTTVGQIMTRDPETLRRSDGIALALNQMSEGGFRHVPIVDGAGRPVGILAMRDIVRFIVSLFPDAVLTVPPDPSAIPTEYGG